MASELPVDDVLRLRQQGFSDEDIVKELEDSGFSFRDIDDAFNQADIKSGVEGKMPEAPLPPPIAPSGMRESALSREDIPVPRPEYSEEPSFVSAPEEVKPVRTFTSPPVSAPELPPSSEEEIQELVESIIDERWQQVIMSVGDINIWKSRVDDELSSVKQEILRFEQRVDNLQRTMIGKVSDYEKSIKKVGSEMEALEKVLSKILEPLASNIKELSRLTVELKKKSK